MKVKRIAQFHFDIAWKSSFKYVILIRDIWHKIILF